MRKELQKYYRDDIDDQKASGKHLFFFTPEGYDHLNALIPLIKSGDAAAENEFMEIILPWAQHLVEKMCSRWDTSFVIDQDHILGEALIKGLQQIKENKALQSWTYFSANFVLGIRHEIIDMVKSEVRHAKKDHLAASSIVKMDIDPEPEALLSAVNCSMRDLGPGDEDMILAHRENYTSKQVASSLGQNENTLRTRAARFSKRLHEAGRKYPALRDWFDTHGIKKSDFDTISLQKVDAVNAQKETVRALFGMSDVMKASIGDHLNIATGTISFWFGEHMEANAALSDRTKAKMSAYLREHGKEDRVEAFEKAFDEMRALVGHKAKKRCDTAGIGAQR